MVSPSLRMRCGLLHAGQHPIALESIKEEARLPLLPTLKFASNCHTDPDVSCTTCGEILVRTSELE